VHGLARAELERLPGDWMARETLTEASFCACRDGLDARVPVDGSLRPAHARGGMPALLALLVDEARRRYG
jgi:hypothetical protein